ncbi:bifunctional 4-hydroxy-2-oxoglutarate aldolase/2-dehydro-3-deoxy-phosphogluconate aldolase [Youxingia wuxianensis]|uniref:2-dehydro-3-deoxy-phosphogluconate aldolase n=1 Tax=Youxingia wuxianensis TaxID=2763678 RepID=A0A926ETQ3_9FIRM|nr:bifunctional 4-hydroxy-2-oxoglutarate aldolase/2-dehydro-3-deoxy-phosphogluconate aldolase [Youxingia wuxianensis]MBC8586432.1 bifunctional 4-hydroxy-2-oxoglutarate aldolase/2-dehydro-3-deoxy-phosphogluconate aldolase [Youxingia wuxianensis]
MNDVLKQLSKIGIVPVIKIDDVDKAIPLAKALCNGGLPCAEITFRTAQGEEAIRRVAKELPEMLVGAGTVLTVDQVDRAVAAGAKFIVSPGLNPKVVKHCIDIGIPVAPGCSSPSDIEAALEMGLTTVKFFPAEQLGGVNFIKALAGPYVNVTFMPTGGVNASNLLDYLSFNKILCCGGTWMVKADLINEGKFDEIERLTRQAVQSMLGFELMHVGINGKNEDEAVKIAKMFETMFGFEHKVGNSSVFAAKCIEVMKTPYVGDNGHIAIGTNFIERAVAYFERNGFAFDMDTAKYDAKGNMIAVYFKDQIGGFGVHLVQKK